MSVYPIKRILWAEGCLGSSLASFGTGRNQDHGRGRGRRGCVYLAKRGSAWLAAWVLPQECQVGRGAGALQDDLTTLGKKATTGGHESVYGRSALHRMPMTGSKGLWRPLSADTGGRGGTHRRRIEPVGRRALGTRKQDDSVIQADPRVRAPTGVRVAPGVCRCRAPTAPTRKPVLAAALAVAWGDGSLQEVACRRDTSEGGDQEYVPRNTAGAGTFGSDGESVGTARKALGFSNGRIPLAFGIFDAFSLGLAVLRAATGSLAAVSTVSKTAVVAAVVAAV